MTLILIIIVILGMPFGSLSYIGNQLEYGRPITKFGIVLNAFCWPAHAFLAAVSLVSDWENLTEDDENNRGL